MLDRCLRDTYMGNNWKKSWDRWVRDSNATEQCSHLFYQARLSPLPTTQGWISTTELEGCYDYYNNMQHRSTAGTLEPEQRPPDMFLSPITALISHAAVDAIRQLVVYVFDASLTFSGRTKQNLLETMWNPGCNDLDGGFARVFGDIEVHTIANFSLHFENPLVYQYLWISQELKFVEVTILQCHLLDK